MSEEYEEENVYVLLDFQGKDTTKFLNQQSIFFRMLNLDGEKPVVEIGTDVYEGEYEDAVGTNIYFEEDEDTSIKDIFEISTPIKLQYLLKQTKILKMSKIGSKSKPVVAVNSTESVNINITDDYRVLLEKFENNKLDIEEYVVAEVSDTVNSEVETENENIQKLAEESIEENAESEWFVDICKDKTADTPSETVSKESKNIFYEKYLKLKRLAAVPNAHKVSEETFTELQYMPDNPKSNFIQWKNYIMRIVENQIIILDVNKCKIEDFVDIESSVKSGIIPSIKETYTKEDKQQLLSFKNFVNVSPFLKLIMLQEFLKMQKSFITKMSAEEVAALDKDGYSIQEKVFLIELLISELRSHIILRIQDELAENNIELIQKDIIHQLLNEEPPLVENNSSEDEDMSS